MHSEHQANMQLHATYVSRGWTVGATFHRPGRWVFIPTSPARQSLTAQIVRLFTSVR